MQAPSECERQGAGEGVVHDEVDLKASEHVAGLHMTCTDHTGRRFAGERPRGDESPEQSICSPRRSVGGRGATVATEVGDAGGRGGRTGANLKNPSTVLPAPSRGAHDRCGRRSRVGDARA